MTFLSNYVPGTVSVAEDFDERLTYSHAVALEHGRFATFWKIGLSPLTWGFRIFEADGTAVTEETIGFTSDASLYFASIQDVSPLPDGGFVVTWIESFDLKSHFLSQYDADGQLVDVVADIASSNVFTDNPLRVPEGRLNTSVSENGAVLHVAEDAGWKMPLSVFDPRPDDALSGALAFTGAGPGPLGPVQFAEAFTALGADYISQLDMTFVTDEVAVAIWEVSSDFLQPKGVYGQLLFDNGTQASAPFAIYLDDRIEGAIQLTALENDRFVVSFYDGDDGNFQGFQIFDVVQNDDDAWQAVPAGDRVLVEFPFGSIKTVNPTNDGGFLTISSVDVRRFDADGVEIPFDAQLFNSGDVAGSELTLDDVIQLSTGEFVSLVGFPVPPNIDDPSYVVATIFNEVSEDIVGTASADELSGTALGELLSGLAGDDGITANGGNDTLEGGAGNDSLFGGDGNDLVQGGDGLDCLEGGLGDDTLNGGNDADKINGALGHDSANGGAGNDTISGGSGNDTLKGGNGADLVRGNTGMDTLFGGLGNDSLRGQKGADRLDGGGGADNLIGGGGNDTLEGGNGNDFLKGGSRQDDIFGGAGNDKLIGNSSDDLLDGGAGNDRLIAGGGDDTLEGGTGDDFLRGGSGADTFVFNPGDGMDTFDDFNFAEDNLQLGNFGLTAQQVEDLAQAVDGDLVIAFSASDSITLDGVTSPDGLAELISFI